MWATWDQAAIAAGVAGVLWLVLRGSGSRRAAYAAPFLAEFALLSVLYAFWRLARKLPLATVDGAVSRARDLASLEAWLHLPSELTLQRFVLRHELLADAVTAYYAIVHVPALLAFLVWLFVRHRDQYPRWRNALALVTLGCLIIRYVRVAPPRFLADLGFVDLAQRVGYSVYPGDVSQGVSDQFAAMPSIHVGWAAIVSCGIVAAGTSRWRWLFLLHLFLTVLVVAATGDHWWLDGAVALLLLAGALALDGGVRRRLARRGERQPSQPGSAAPSRSVSSHA
jgi:hypothetical protein